MGFFFEANKPARLTGPSKSSVGLLHRAGCKACPLDKAACRTPKMEPSGGEGVYILGANPTAAADKKGVPMTGTPKDFMLGCIPRSHIPSLRYNNIVRTAAGQKLTQVMIECCRPSIIADIEDMQPKAIIGLGEDVLHWALNQSGMRKWTGRHIPIKIGEHICWFFPLSDPAEVMKTRKYEWNESEEEFTFRLQVADAFRQIDLLPDAPEPHDAEYAREGIVQIDGSNGTADLELLADMLARLGKEGHAGVDYETNGVRGYNKGKKLLTMAIAGREECLAVALRHSRAKWSKSHLEQALKLIEDWLYEAACRKVSHSLPFELEWSALNFGKEVVRATRWEDTVTQAWVLDERNKMGKPDCLSLEFLCIQYFGLNIKALNTLETDDLDDAPLDLVLEYNGIDAKYHRHLFLRQALRIKQEGFTAQYEHMLARIPACVLSQIKGVPINQARVRNFKRYYDENLKLIMEDIQASEAARAFKKKYGKTFDPGNNKEVLKLITEVLQEDATNKKEKQSSGLEVLERIDDPIADFILEWRSDDKARSTYVLSVYEGDAAIPRAEHLHDDGLIHPTISTTRTDTSRTASNDPNAQNWPKHKKSKVVRSQIEPEEDERVVSFDYAGIQARNIAMESLDPAFIESFWTGYDPHGDWSKWLAEKAGSDWKYVHAAGGLKAFFKDKDQMKASRSKVKNGFVFPTFFGAQPRGIAIALDVEQEIIAEAQELLFQQFPLVKEWQDSIREHYAEHGWITGLSGIRRRAPCSPNQLINAPIQADEAWIVLDAMDRISQLAVPAPRAKRILDLSADYAWHLQPNMEIHDDLTFIWPKKEIDTLAPIIISEMLAVPYKWAHVVPIEIEMSVGTNWSNCKEIGKFRSDTWKDRGYRREDYA